MASGAVYVTEKNCDEKVKALREQVRYILEYVAYGVGSTTGKVEADAQAILDGWRDENLEPRSA